MTLQASNLRSVVSRLSPQHHQQQQQQGEGQQPQLDVLSRRQRPSCEAQAVKREEAHRKLDSCLASAQKTVVKWKAGEGARYDLGFLGGSSTPDEKSEAGDSPRHHDDDLPEDVREAFDRVAGIADAANEKSAREKAEKALKEGKEIAAAPAELATTDDLKSIGDIMSLQKLASAVKKKVADAKERSEGETAQNWVVNYGGDAYNDDQAEIMGWKAAAVGIRNRRSKKKQEAEKLKELIKFASARRVSLKKVGRLNMPETSNSEVADFLEVNDSEALSRIAEDMFDIYLDRPRGTRAAMGNDEKGGKAGQLAEKVKQAISGNTSVEFLRVARVQRELRSKLAEVDKFVDSLSRMNREDIEIGHHNNEIANDVFGSLLPPLTGMSKHAETSMRMKMLRKLVNSLHWPQLQVRLRLWIKTSAEIEQSARGFMKIAQREDEEITEVVDFGTDLVKQSLAQRDLNLVDQLEQFNSKMRVHGAKFEARNEATTGEGAGNDKDDISRNQRSHQVDRLLEKQAMERQLMIQKSNVKLKDRAGQPGKEETEKVTRFAEGTLPELDTQLPTARSSPAPLTEDSNNDNNNNNSKANSGGEKEALASPNSARSVKMSAASEGDNNSDDGSIDLSVFDDHKFGHLKSIYMKHKQKLDEVKVAMDRMEQKTRTIRTEITKCLESEDGSQSKVNLLMAHMTPQQQRKIMLHRERDALTKFLNEATSKDLEDPSASKTVVSKNEEAPPIPGQPSPRSMDSPRPPRREVESPPANQYSSSASTMSAAESRSKQPVLPSRPGPNRSGQAAAPAGPSLIELESQVAKVEEAIKAMKGTVVSSVKDVNQKAHQLGIGSGKAWTFEMIPTFRAWFMINPQEPILKTIEKISEELEHDVTIMGKDVGSLEPAFYESLQVAKATVQADSDARRSWRDEDAKYNSEHWRQATTKAITDLIARFDEWEKACLECENHSPPQMAADGGEHRPAPILTDIDEGSSATSAGALSPAGQAGSPQRSFPPSPNYQSSSQPHLQSQSEIHPLSPGQSHPHQSYTQTPQHFQPQPEHGHGHPQVHQPSPYQHMQPQHPQDFTSTWQQPGGSAGLSQQVSAEGLNFGVGPNVAPSKLMAAGWMPQNGFLQPAQLGSGSNPHSPTSMVPGLVPTVTPTGGVVPMPPTDPESPVAKAIPVSPGISYDPAGNLLVHRDSSSSSEGLSVHPPLPFFNANLMLAPGEAPPSDLSRRCDQAQIILQLADQLRELKRRVALGGLQLSAEGRILDTQGNDLLEALLKGSAQVLEAKKGPHGFVESPKKKDRTSGAVAGKQVMSSMLDSIPAARGSVSSEEAEAEAAMARVQQMISQARKKSRRGKQDEMIQISTLIAQAEQANKQLTKRRDAKFTIFQRYMERKGRGADAAVFQKPELASEKKQRLKQALEDTSGNVQILQKMKDFWARRITTRHEKAEAEKARLASEFGSDFEELIAAVGGSEYSTTESSNSEYETAGKKTEDGQTVPGESQESWDGKSAPANWTKREKGDHADERQPSRQRSQRRKRRKSVFGRSKSHLVPEHDPQKAFEKAKGDLASAAALPRSPPTGFRGASVKTIPGFWRRPKSHAQSDLASTAGAESPLANQRRRALTATSQDPAGSSGGRLLFESEERLYSSAGSQDRSRRPSSTGFYWQDQARSVLAAFDRRPSYVHPFGVHGPVKGLAGIGEPGALHDKEALKQISMALMELAAQEKAKQDAQRASSKPSTPIDPKSSSLLVTPDVGERARRRSSSTLEPPSMDGLQGQLQGNSLRRPSLQSSQGVAAGGTLGGVSQAWVAKMKKKGRDSKEERGSREGVEGLFGDALWETPKIIVQTKPEQSQPLEVAGQTSNEDESGGEAFDRRRTFKLPSSFDPAHQTWSIFDAPIPVEKPVVRKDSKRRNMSKTEEEEPSMMEQFLKQAANTDQLVIGSANAKARARWNGPRRKGPRGKVKIEGWKVATEPESDRVRLAKIRQERVTQIPVGGAGKEVLGFLQTMDENDRFKKANPGHTTPRERDREDVVEDAAKALKDLRDSEDEVWNKDDTPQQRLAVRACALLVAKYGDATEAFKAWATPVGLSYKITRSALANALAEWGFTPADSDTVFRQAAVEAGLRPGVTRELSRQEFSMLFMRTSPSLTICDFKRRVLKRYGREQEGFFFGDRDGNKFLDISEFLWLSRSLGVPPASAKEIFQQMTEQNQGELLPGYDSSVAADGGRSASPTSSMAPSMSAVATATDGTASGPISASAFTSAAASAAATATSIGAGIAAAALCDRLEEQAYKKSLKHAEALDYMKKLRQLATKNWTFVEEVFPSIDRRCFQEPVRFDKLASCLASAFGSTSPEAKALFKFVVACSGDPTSNTVDMSDVVLRILGGCGYRFAEVCKKAGLPQFANRKQRSRSNTRSPDSRFRTARSASSNWGSDGSSNRGASSSPRRRRSRSPAMRLAVGSSRSPRRLLTASDTSDHKFGMTSPEQMAATGVAATAEAEGDRSSSSSTKKQAPGEPPPPSRPPDACWRLLRGLSMDSRFRTFQRGMNLFADIQPHEALGRAEFTLLLVKRLQFPPQACKSLFDSVKHPHSEGVTIVDFIRAVRRARPVRTLPHLRNVLQRKLKVLDGEDAFHLLDPLQHGFVDVEEFIERLGKYGVEAEDARTLFHDLDLNGDGHASFAEFVDELWTRRSVNSHRVGQWIRRITRLRVSLQKVEGKLMHELKEFVEGADAEVPITPGDVMRLCSKVGVPPDEAWNLFVLVDGSKSQEDGKDDTPSRHLLLVDVVHRVLAGAWEGFTSVFPETAPQYHSSEIPAAPYNTTAASSEGPIGVHLEPGSQSQTDDEESAPPSRSKQPPPQLRREPSDEQPPSFSPLPDVAEFEGESCAGKELLSEKPTSWPWAGGPLESLPEPGGPGPGFAAPVERPGSLESPPEGRQCLSSSGPLRLPPLQESQVKKPATAGNYPRPPLSARCSGEAQPRKAGQCVELPRISQSAGDVPRRNLTTPRSRERCRDRDMAKQTQQWLLLASQAEGRVRPGSSDREALQAAKEQVALPKITPRSEKSSSCSARRDDPQVECLE